MEFARFIKLNFLYEHMPTATKISPEQETRLDGLVQETLGNKKPLRMGTIMQELEINHETARDLMRPYLQSGLGHYNPSKGAFLPNHL